MHPHRKESIASNTLSTRTSTSTVDLGGSIIEEQEKKDILRETVDALKENDSNESEEDFDSEDLIGFCWQVSSGMVSH